MTDTTPVPSREAVEAVCKRCEQWCDCLAGEETVVGMLRTLLAEVERLTGELEKIDTRWHMAALDADTLRATVAEQGAALAEIQSACDAGDLHSAKLHCRAALASAQSAQPVQRTD